MPKANYSLRERSQSSMHAQALVDWAINWAMGRGPVEGAGSSSFLGTALPIFSETSDFLPSIRTARVFSIQSHSTSIGLVLSGHCFRFPTWHGTCGTHRQPRDSGGRSMKREKSISRDGAKPGKRTAKPRVSGEGGKSSHRIRAENDQFQQMNGAESTYFKKA